MVEPEKYFERLVRVETEVSGLREQAKAHAIDTKENFTKVNQKLDDLMNTIGKARGMGMIITFFGAGLVSWVLGKVLH